MLAFRSSESGDTIIEVVFAVMIFSLVAISGISIMNQGIATTQRSLEINLVRQQMDTQAEALRYLNHRYVASYGTAGDASTAWAAVRGAAGGGLTEASKFDEMVTSSNECAAQPNAVVLDVKKLDTATPKIATPISWQPTTYAQIRRSPTSVQSEGISVQAVPSPVIAGDKTGFVDFHVRACWQSPGQVRPVTLATIVRLYEPRP